MIVYIKEFISTYGALINLMLFVVLVSLLIIFFIRIRRLQTKTIETISNAVQPHFIELTPSAQAVIALAIDIRRTEYKVKDIIHKISENEQEKINTSLNRLKKFLTDNWLEYKDFTWEKYNEDISAIEVIDSQKSPDKINYDTIKETLDPAIFVNGQLVKKAKVSVVLK